MVYVVRHRRRRLIHLTAASVAMASSRLSRCCCLAFHASTLAFQSLNGHHPPRGAIIVNISLSLSSLGSITGFRCKNNF